MKKIAINIVLLPSEKMMDKAIELNNKLISNSKPVKLNKENCLPHISLCMASVDKDKLSEFKLILDRISKQFTELSLNISKLVVDSISTGEKWSSLKINKTPEVQLLHEEIMNNFKSYISSNIKKEMCYSPNEVNKLTIQWAKGYIQNSAYENFSSHISLGVGEIEEQDLNIQFKGTRIAICHLGNYCTCRKVLIENDLGL